MEDFPPIDRLAPADAQLRAWMASRLDPWTGAGAAAARSDLDLNPDVDPAVFSALRPAAVLVPLVERVDGLSVLLTRRADTLRSHRGQIAFPGGVIDPGETPWQAALREASEEVGLDDGHIALAGLSTPFMTQTGFHVTPVVAFVRPGFDLRPNPEEVAEVFEVPFDFLMDAANHVRELRQFPAGASRWVYTIAHGERIIWGVTAAILRNLHERLYSPADD